MWVLASLRDYSLWRLLDQIGPQVGPFLRVVQLLEGGAQPVVERMRHRDLDGDQQVALGAVLAGTPRPRTRKVRPFGVPGGCAA